ncbi:UPF0149 family protein [Rhodopseudomonas telluris]|uniref:UPF0149 family protein n=1 Tax=Rhodopseudomonas telluris TaxID=644215 RepID=A0ABV6EW39_9BRAD
MPELPPHLAQLEDELDALGPDAMLVEELDGFVAGLLVCPEQIKPGDWLPAVWNGDDESSPFTDLAHANRVFALIMAHYNSVAATLFERPERYHPLLPVDTESGDVVWEVWVDGFAAAVSLRPQAWQCLQDADKATVEALEGLVGLVEISADGSETPQNDLEAIGAEASEQIAGWIRALNTWRLANDPGPRHIEWGAPPPASAKRGKVGRNEPCPCGSGKKYKRCCGMN